MKKTIEITTHFDLHPDRVWAEVNKPDLLLFVAQPVIRFTPIKPPSFPVQWQEDDYIVHMSWYGILSLGQQMISISRPAKTQNARELRDNGHSALIRRWDHRIMVEADSDGTRYTDRVEIDAGIITPLVAAFAYRFYVHRQKRWHKLIETDFDYAQN